MTPEIESQIKKALSMFADERAYVNKDGYQFTDEIIAEKMGIAAANVFGSAITSTDRGYRLESWYTVETLWEEMAKKLEAKIHNLLSVYEDDGHTTQQEFENIYAQVQTIMGIAAANVFVEAMRIGDNGSFLDISYTVESLWKEMLKAKQEEDTGPEQPV